MRALFVVALLALAGCSANEAVLGGTELVLRVRDPLELHGTAPLRYAVTWPKTSTTGKTQTIGVEVGGGEITTSSITISIPPPTAEVLEGAARLSSDRGWGGVHRLRVLLYEDVDRDGHPSPPDVDRWMAIDQDGEAVVALEDVDGLLAQVDLAYQFVVYDATGGRYSPFVRATVRTPVASITQKWSPDLFLELGPSDYPEANLLCPRVTTVYDSRTSVFLDGLDAALCGLEAAECSIKDLDALEPPNVTPSLTTGAYRRVECHERDLLAALLVIEHQPRCSECVCTETDLVSAYVTTATAAPAWWPCGQSIDYCPDTVGLTKPDFACALANQR